MYPRPRLTNETTHRIDEMLQVPVATSTVPLSSEAVRSSNTSTSKIISNASEALMMARRLRSHLSSKAEAVTVSDVAPEGSLRNVQMIIDFISEIGSLAEETELYFKDADRIRNLEQLAEITQKATHFRLALRSSTADPRTGTAQHQTPTSDATNPDLLRREFFHHSSSTSDDTSMRMWAFDHISNLQPGFSHTAAENLTTPGSHSDDISSNESPLQDRSRDNNDIFRMSTASMSDALIPSENKMSTKNQVNLHGWSKFSLAMDPKASLTCSFVLEASEGSVLLKVIPTEGPYGTSDAVVPCAGLLYQSNSSSRSFQSMSHSTPTMSHDPFHHRFQCRNRPIPHLLHPDVEGPTEEPDAPYTITFTERQSISAEGVSEGPQWTTSLMYIFYEKQDQITLCEMIYGKTLLMSAGTDKIDYNGREIAHMSAVAVWFDDASGIKSITFFPNLNGKKTTSKDMELRIHGLWALNKAPRNPNVLALIAESMPRDDEGLNMSARPERQPSIKSGGTFLSKASLATPQKQKKSGKLKCVIQFTRSNDRASFMNHLT